MMKIFDNARALAAATAVGMVIGGATVGTVVDVGTPNEHALNVKRSVVSEVFVTAHDVYEAKPRLVVNGKDTTTVIEYDTVAVPARTVYPAPRVNRMGDNGILYPGDSLWFTVRVRAAGGRDTTEEVVYSPVNANGVRYRAKCDFVPVTEAKATAPVEVDEIGEVVR